MPPSGTPQGVSGVPRSEWGVLPSRRLKPVGNRALLGVRRGQRKLPPRERDVYIQNGGIFRCSEKTGSFVGTSPMLATFFPAKAFARNRVEQTRAIDRKKGGVNMAVSAEKRSSRVRRQASKKQPKNRTVQVRFSDEELAALDAVCESTGMTRSAVLRSWTVPGEGAGSNPVYVVTKNADAERLAMEARRIGVNVNQIARALNAEAKGRGGLLRSDTLDGCEKSLEEVRGELSKLAREVETLRQDFGSDMFSALMYSDDPGRLRRLVNYWFGMGGDA